MDPIIRLITNDSRYFKSVLMCSCSLAIHTFALYIQSLSSCSTTFNTFKVSVEYSHYRVLTNEYIRFHFDLILFFVAWIFMKNC